MQAESEKSKILTEKELTIKKIQAQLEEILGDRKMVGWVIALSALFLFVLLWVVVKLFREYQNHRRRLEEERMKHEKELQEKELQTRLAEKMFEALGSGNLTEEQQNRLLESLANPNRQIPLKK
jgi:flagellar biosynthesis/type III secretory pathway M-ring protein FliF/YscJ